jgi:RNA polymerase sigma-70 factor (ECF subfamily)
MPTPAGNHDDLARRLRAGDREALADLFAAQRDRLWRIVDFRLDPRLRRRLDADDVLQQAYLDAAQRLEHFRGEGATSAFVWLRLIVTQTLADLHRTHLGAQMRDAGREIFLDAGAAGTSVSLARHLIGSLTSPSGVAARAESVAQLEAALAEMDTIDREVLALRHFEELSNSEVAEVLGIQPKAASIRYVRALKRLRMILAELPGFGE